MIPSIEDRERWAEIVRLDAAGDLFRDNEKERARTGRELEYFAAEYDWTLTGDLCGNCGARASLDQTSECGGGSAELLPLSELEDEDLEAIVRTAKTGGNELAQREAREAQATLDQRQAKETA